MKAKAYTAAEVAERDLRWLQEVRAVRRFEVLDDGGFTVETPDGKLHELDAGAVAGFRTGVLVGWRLPRSGADG